jgi:hypothetical protein
VELQKLRENIKNMQTQAIDVTGDSSNVALMVEIESLQEELCEEEEVRGVLTMEKNQLIKELKETLECND